MRPEDQSQSGSSGLTDHRNGHPSTACEVPVPPNIGKHLATRTSLKNAPAFTLMFAGAGTCKPPSSRSSGRTRARRSRRSPRSGSPPGLGGGPTRPHQPVCIGLASNYSAAASGSQRLLGLRILARGFDSSRCILSGRCSSGRLCSRRRAAHRRERPGRTAHRACGLRQCWVSHSVGDGAEQAQFRQGA
jgi:hypothetical protein